MPFLTLFTAPKPFVDLHISLIQRNTLVNWLALGESVEVLVLGDEPGIAEACQSVGVRHLPGVRLNESGTPLISSIFSMARDKSASPFLAYANADILFLPDLLTGVQVLADQSKRFLMVGQRYDLDITDPLDFREGWAEQLQRQIDQDGRLHKPTGSDYFVYPRDCFQQIPDFAVGRAGWDNWMLYWARYQNWPLVDATGAVTLIHQNHDYRHLPGGIKHFFQPETAVNVKLAGGRRTIFRLTDARYVLSNGKLQKTPFTWRSFWREMEIFPLVRLHSRILGSFAFAIFHPIQAFNEVKGWLAYKMKQGK